MSISPLLEIASSYCLSPRLRTAPTVAHEEHDYSMDLRVAKWGPMPWCMAVFLNCRRCPLWPVCGRRPLLYVAPLSLAGIRNPTQCRKSHYLEYRNDALVALVIWFRSKSPHSPRANHN